RRLVRAGADPVADRMGRLAGKAELLDPLPHEPVELRHARARPAVVDRAAVDGQQALLELAVVLAQLADAEQLRVVGPVPVGADPDLEQHRLALDDRPVARRGERLDAAPRPDQREAERELDLALPARALTVDEALPERSDLALGHADLQLAPGVLR